MNLSYGDGVTTTMQAWIEDAIALTARMPWDKLLPTSAVEFVVVDGPPCPGHADYMCTQTNVDGDSVVSIRTGATDPAAPFNAGLPGPLRSFFVESVVHEMAHILTFIKLHVEDRAEVAALFTKAQGRVKGTEDDWNPLDKAWEERIQEAVAEVVKDSILDSSQRVYENRTVWETNQAGMDRLAELLALTPGDDSPWDQINDRVLGADFGRGAYEYTTMEGFEDGFRLTLEPPPVPSADAAYPGPRMYVAPNYVGIIPEKFDTIQARVIVTANNTNDPPEFATAGDCEVWLNGRRFASVLGASMYDPADGYLNVPDRGNWLWHSEWDEELGRFLAESCQSLGQPPVDVDGLYEPRMGFPVKVIVRAYNEGLSWNPNTNVEFPFRHVFLQYRWGNPPVSDLELPYDPLVLSAEDGDATVLRFSAPPR